VVCFIKKERRVGLISLPCKKGKKGAYYAWTNIVYAIATYTSFSKLVFRARVTLASHLNRKSGNLMTSGSTVTIILKLVIYPRIRKIDDVNEGIFLMHSQRSFFTRCTSSPMLVSLAGTPSRLHIYYSVILLYWTKNQQKIYNILYIHFKHCEQYAL
jgi:hypothetical protein